MHRLIYGIAICGFSLLIMSCATVQSRYVIIGQAYPSLPEKYEIDVFLTDSPEKQFVRVSRLDVHLEKSFFVGSCFEDALPELKKQARLSGADAVIEIQEHHSTVGETKIYHVTAIGIRYTELLHNKR